MQKATLSFTDLARELTPYEVRARKLLVAGPVDLINNPCFGDSDQADAILAEMPPVTRKPRKAKPPAGLDDPYLLDLYNGVPLLEREQEAHEFRKLNFLKFRYNQELPNLRPTRPLVGVLNRLEALRQQWISVHGYLVRANLRLVVSTVKALRDRGKYLERDFNGMISDGNVAVMGAANKFDFALGNKFSTYATYAIRNNLVKGISADDVPEALGSGGDFGDGLDEDPMERIPEERSDEQEDLGRHHRVKEAVRTLLDSLQDPRDRRVIEARFGLFDEEELTLESLGRELGITKERVRQIESRAEERLRKAHPELALVLN
jgi:RNA polymerase primary sigma factor